MTRGHGSYIHFHYFLFYYYSILLASLPFSMANHLGLDRSVSQMVEEWDTIHECSAPVGAPGHITQIEHHDDISFLRHSWLTGFWEPDLANPVWINDVIDFFYSPKSSIILVWLRFTVQLVQEYVHSCFLHTKYFYLYLYIRWLPTFQMGYAFLGFLPMNLSILPSSSILHTKVQSD